MDAFTIKDLESLSGIKAHTIRIWEQRYSFLKPQRTSTNIRYYSNEELKALLNIALLNRYGYKISHIDRMPPEEIGSRILSLTDPQAVQARLINELVKQMVDLEIREFEHILSGYMNAKGVERTVNQIIFPFLDRIGILWQTGHINPAQEHLVTNLIRQKLIAAIDTVVPRPGSSATFMLFLPEGEHHELGLLYIHYLLKVRGIQVIYLGANVPLNDIIYVARLKNPDYLYCHLTGSANPQQVEKFLTTLLLKLPETSLAVSGHFSHSLRGKSHPNLLLIRSLTEAIEFISAK